MGAGFGESGPTVGVAGELGCSDIPGWGEGDSHHNQDKPNPAGDKAPGKSGSSEGDGIASTNLRRNVDSPHDSELQSGGNDELSSPPTNDGTDDHLHHPLPQSGVVDNSAEKRGESGQAGQAAHADIQSLQESAEIAGKIVLLSRGGCGFLEKAKWVQRRGGVALIVGDDTRGGGLVTMYARGDTSNVTIPALFTSHTTAQLLSSLMPPQTAEDPSLRTRPKASHTRPPSQSSVAKHGPSAIGSAIPTRSATPHTDKSTQVDSKGKTGIFNSVLSLLGLGSGRQTWPPTEDSRRPPSSGNIDWVVLGSWDEEETSLDGLKDSVDLSHVRSKPSSIPGGSKKAKSKATGADGDGFVIGVQDWRDPDAMAPKSSVHPAPSMTRRSQTNEKGSGYSPTPLKGGSRTPGSGEYQNVEEPSSSKEAVAKGRQSAAAFQSAPPAPGKNWFSRHFAWTEEKEPDADQSSIPRGEPSNTDETKRRGSSSAQNHRIIKSSDHKGLWVTLTPTSMSTSPFFDTLLVLVVSPLLTLTVVYALLLLRARIRRRRWRAPKSVVDRLPVRTYHTIARSSSPSSSSSRRSDRAESPSPALPTSPLLGSASRSSGSRSRPRSQTMSGFVPGSAGSSNVELSSKEKPAQGPSVWKRKYTGRQVECVVCLEEYVDGQSRVMSLPCGHEFHAECM